MAGGRDQQGQLELGPVDVLDLVDQQLGAGRAPAGQELGLGLEQCQRARHQVVEVQPTGRREGALVGDERSRARAGLRVRRDGLDVDAMLELERREGRVQPSALGRVGIGDDPAEHLVAIDQRLDRSTGRPQDLAAKGMERADPDGPRRDLQRPKSGGHPLLELVGRPLVERYGGDPVGRRPGRHEPGDPGDQGGRLATASRGQAQDGSMLGRRRRPLVRRQAVQSSLDVGVEGHSRSLALRAYQRIEGTRSNSRAPLRASVPSTGGSLRWRQDP